MLLRRATRTVAARPRAAVLRATTRRFTAAARAAPRALPGPFVLAAGAPLLLALAPAPARLDRAALDEEALKEMVARVERLRDEAAREAPRRPRWRRLARRALHLACKATPLVASRGLVAGAKLAGRGDRWEDWWWGYCLETIEAAGPTFVKLCQWAAARDDIFPAAATKRFARLHDRVTPHAFAVTKASVDATFGEDAVDVAPFVLGSGCVAQVHRGVVKATGRSVAVKVVHPGVRDLVEADMALLKLAGETIERVAPSLRYLAVRGSVERFEALMRAQLDLRTEAANLERLAHLFAKDEGIVVPRPVVSVGRRDGAQRDVLVEDFCEGVPVLEYFDRHQGMGPELARRGAETILKMVLHHNFVHGDLHPGNMLVDSAGRLVLLDAGICVEIPDNTHDVMVQVLKAMLETRGEDAGRLLLATDVHAAEARDEGSDAREEAFVKGFAAFVEKTRHQPIWDSLASYVSYVCDLAVTNRVALDASFVSVALAVKVMEGLVIDLEPDFGFVEIAMPMFLKAHMARQSKKELARLSDYSRAMLRRVQAETVAQR